MGWTVPRTWITDEVVSAATGNTHWRDNLAWLGTDKPHCRVFNSANLSIANNTVTQLTYNSERFDVAAMHDTATNTGRLTIPTGGGGKYLDGVNVDWGSGGTGHREVRLLRNGTAIIGVERIETGGTNTHRQSVLTVSNLSAADWLSCDVLHTQGAALNVTTNAEFSPEMFAIWLST